MSTYSQTKAYRNKNKDKKVCRYCSKPSNGMAACDQCRAAISKHGKETRSIWAISGLCTSCGSNRMIGKNTCDICYYRDIANNSLNGSSQYKLLIEMYVNQNMKCAMTGDTINPLNMELDHIIPISKGGHRVISNVRWVTKDANRAKQALLDEDFILLCHKIINFNQTK